MFHTMVSAAESGKLGDETPRAGRAAERTRVLAVLNSRELVDLAPMQFYTKLLDQGIYPGWLSTFYRPWRKATSSKNDAGWPNTRPGRFLSCWPRPLDRSSHVVPMWHQSWDITKLAGPVKGKYFDCYMMVDIRSRFIVGTHVHATESGVLAVEMMKGIFGIHGIPQVMHADRGNVHDVQNRRRAAPGSGGHQVALQAPGVQ